MSKKLAVVAVGGNSLITDKKHPDVPHQWDAVRETVRHLADMIVNGWTLVVTHGNGPQGVEVPRRGVGSEEDSVHAGSGSASCGSFL